MADTCYLCAVGAPLGKSTIGTCTECSVHVCAKHGDRDPVYFRCADCITGSAARSVIMPDMATHELVTKHGAYALFARSPMLALVGARLFLLDLVRPMHNALRQFGAHPRVGLHRARHWLERHVSGLTTSQLAFAVGLDETEVATLLEVDRAPQATEVLTQLARVKIEMTFDQLTRDLSGGDHLRFDDAQASYALAVLAVALGARDADALTDPVMGVRGGLYLPSYVILLSTLLVEEV